MTRLFILLPFVVGALANIGMRSDHMESSSGSKDKSGGDLSTSYSDGMEGNTKGEKGYKNEYKGDKDYKKEYKGDMNDSKNKMKADKGDMEDDGAIDITVGDVRIKIIGSFNGLGNWEWQGDQPGEEAKIHQVTVGDLKDGTPVLAYDPPSLDAEAGDYVQFNFKAQNHTVTQSTFDKPCVKMQDGMDSGFMPNPNNTMPVPPSMMVAINDTKPLWFYCRQKSHCGKGMAFGINPGGPDKMAEFLEKAKIQNATAEDGAASPNGLAASNSTSGGQNGLPASSAVASPTATPLSNLVPGQGQLSGGDGSMDACACNCLCDMGQPGMGGMIGSMPMPSTGAMGKRGVQF